MQYSLRKGLFIVIALVVFASTYGLVSIQNRDIGHVESSWALLHYYINAKYFKELGYFDLYACVLAVHSESSFVHANKQVRNLENYRLTYWQEEKVKCPEENFTQRRWETFSQEVKQILSHQQPSYWVGVLKDKGFNPSPAWLLAGQPFANSTLVGEPLYRATIQLDWMVITALLVTVALAVSPGIAVTLGFFFIMFYGTFGRLMGNYFQYVWLAASIGGLVTWLKRRYAISALCFAVAVSFRLFPALFLLGLMCKAIYAILVKDHPTRTAYITFWMWFVWWGIVVFFLSGLVFGFEAWVQFFEKIIMHARYIIAEPFHIGLHSMLIDLVSNEVLRVVVSLLITSSAVILYLIAVLKHSSIISVGLGAILMYFLLTSSPYYTVGVGLILIDNKTLGRFAYIPAVFLLGWVLLVAILVPGAFYDLRNIAHPIVEVLTLAVMWSLLLFFAVVEAEGGACELEASN